MVSMGGEEQESGGTSGPTSQDIANALNLSQSKFDSFKDNVDALFPASAENKRRGYESAFDLQRQGINPRMKLISDTERDVQTMIGQGLAGGSDILRGRGSPGLPEYIASESPDTSYLTGAELPDPVTMREVQPEGMERGDSLQYSGGGYGGGYGGYGLGGGYPAPNPSPYNPRRPEVWPGDPTEPTYDPRPVRG